MKVIVATCPTDHAKGLAKTLLDAKLVACVNIIPSVVSMYIWNDSVVEDSESLLLIKTSTSLVSAVEAAFHQAHPYDVPEFILLGVDEAGSSQAYLAWVHQVTQGSLSES
jgi:periplasmic divalent cation tolerance protein